jgi:flagellar assembly protein FliH
VLKAKSDETTRPLKNVEKFSAWSLPKLGKTNVPGFQQPVEEVEIKPEPEITEAELAKIKADELKAIKEAAYQEGFDLGQKEGLLAAKGKIDQESAFVRQLVSELREPLKQCEEKTQQQLLELSFAIARQIVRRELQQDPSQLIAIIRDALKLLPIGTQKVNIALHPEDARMIKDKLSIDSEHEDSSEQAENLWKINQDPAVERGSCLVTTENSKIDASIDKQVAILFSRIAGGLRADEVVHENNKEQLAETKPQIAEDINTKVDELEESAINQSQDETELRSIKIESTKPKDTPKSPPESTNE